MIFVISLFPFILIFQWVENGLVFEKLKSLNRSVWSKISVNKG